MANFIVRNGFAIQQLWLSTQGAGRRCLWLAARKRRHIEALDGYAPVTQAYVNGVKQPIR